MQRRPLRNQQKTTVVESEKKEQEEQKSKKIRVKIEKNVTFAEGTKFNKDARTSKICCIYKIGDDKSKNKYERG